MKTYTNRPPGFLKLAAMAIIGFVASTVFVQGTAFATTAANAVITNTATVSWEDSNNANPASTTASVNVTVSLVAATPSLSAPANQAVDSNSSIDYTYTITTNANGFDTYTLSAAQQAADAGITGDALEIRDTAGGGGSIIPSVDLAATSVATAEGPIADGASLQIDVPNDGTAGGGLNGFTGGETIIVDQGGNNWLFSVVSVDNDNASGMSQMTIQNNSGGSVSLTVGMLIAEQQTFYLRVTPTTTVDGDTVTNRLTADDGVSTAAFDDTVTTVNYTAPSITVTKYVRNASNAAGNTGGAGGQSINGATYFTSGVTGNPGDTLEYVIVVANAGGAGSATDVVISDPIPAFTTYVGSSMDYDNHTAITGSGSWTSVTDAENDTDKGEFDPTSGAEEVWIYAGTGGADTGTATTYGDGTGGTVSGGNFTFGRFQVTIDN